jgi:hypothetical protein
MDPLGKWKGTHELERQYLLRFFRWLYAPKVENKKRPTPDVMCNIPKLRRPEEKPVKTLKCGQKKTNCYFANTVILKEKKLYYE